ncbi:hypothetical protein Acsp02_67990 [Actinoplanes sp. NBRC 103695]|nr:hypothetical protein Acsp02_67990 [Actinoplanes sp. NBRC 103695]
MRASRLSARMTERAYRDEYVREDRLYPMWRLLLVSGLRRGELCGLRCGDLETDQGALKVCRQIVVEDPGSRLRVKPPKSHNSVRTLVLDPVTRCTRSRCGRRCSCVARSRARRPS